MKLYHCSDTHGFHLQLNIPDGIDMIIHSGDATNSKNKIQNTDEFIAFVEWYSKLDIKCKIYVAGNHDGSLEAKMFTKEFFDKNGIIYLQDSEVIIDGLKIYGSPYTPTRNDWCFMKKRDKLHDVWQKIPEDTDILVTHGPPKGMLDLSEDRDGKLEMCGDKALLKRVMIIKPKINLFGHIHNTREICNTGFREVDGIIFSNASAVTDARFDKGITFHGNTINI